VVVSNGVALFGDTGAYPFSEKQSGADSVDPDLRALGLGQAFRQVHSCIFMISESSIFRRRQCWTGPLTGCLRDGVCHAASRRRQTLRKLGDPVILS
jgi:hypothetical protein